MNQQPQTDETLVARVVAAVLRELGYGDPLPRPEPELLPDPEVRRRFFGGCSRTKYWELTKRPDFPVAVQLGHTNYRRVDDVRRYLAECEVI
jgi:hypothetical protein